MHWSFMCREISKEKTEQGEVKWKEEEEEEKEEGEGKGKREISILAAQ